MASSSGTWHGTDPVACSAAWAGWRAGCAPCLDAPAAVAPTAVPARHTSTSATAAHAATAQPAVPAVPARLARRPARERVVSRRARLRVRAAVAAAAQLAVCVGVARTIARQLPAPRARHKPDNTGRYGAAPALLEDAQLPAAGVWRGSAPQVSGVRGLCAVPDGASRCAHTHIAAALAAKAHWHSGPSREPHAYGALPLH